MAVGTEAEASDPDGGVVQMTAIETGMVVVQGLLGVALLVAGGTKLAAEEIHVDQFDHFGYPQWFRTLTGVLEIAAALALFVSILVVPELALVGGVLGTVVMTGAVYTHLRIGDPVSELRGPGLLLGLAVFVTLYQALLVLG